MRGVRGWAVGLLMGGLLTPGAGAEQGWSPTTVVERAMSAAERSLQRGDFAAAESHYHEVLLESWRLMGTLERLEGRLPEAREAYRNALLFVGENRQARQALAFALLRTGEAAEAAGVLRPIAVGTPVTRRPPHRPERAPLTHSVPALGVEAEACVGIGVHDAGGR